MKRPRYRRLRKPGARWHGRNDSLSVSIVRYHRDGSTSFRWSLIPTEPKPSFP